MLLLVLILVLIAFGLLVVALLTSSVLWAWVSVGVSVAAAAVLLVDWLQRRSAVRAGAEAGDPSSVPAAAPVPPPAMREHVVEPATEVIPAVRADQPYPGGPVDGRHDERPDARETVVMRAFAPSGSTGGPPGARDGIGPSGPSSSQSVTHQGAEPTAANGREPDPAPVEGDPDSETVKVSGQQPAVRDEPRAPELPPLGPDGAPPEEPRDADAAGLVAELDDEVLVVDELPRYHLAGCRSLAGVAVIPLPAREAVELGFTPCAWCAPDRNLSARHRAPAR